MDNNQFNLAELNQKLDEVFRSDEGFDEKGMTAEEYEEIKRKSEERHNEIVRKMKEEMDPDIAEAYRKHTEWWNEIIRRDAEEIEKRGGYWVVKKMEELE